MGINNNSGWGMDSPQDICREAIRGYLGKEILDEIGWAIAELAIWTQDEWTILECGELEVLNAISDGVVTAQLMECCGKVGLPTRLSFRVGGEEKLKRTLLRCPTFPRTLTMNNDILPRDLLTSERALARWVLDHESPAVLVVAGAVLACSEPYESMTGRSYFDWLMDWTCPGDGTAPVHGNLTRHVGGELSRLEAALEAAEGGVLRDFQWQAILARDNSLRLWSADLQLIQVGNRKGRVVVLKGEPQPVPVGAEVDSEQT